MKKINTILIALLIAVISLFGFVGCESSSQNDLQSKIDELQSKIEELEEQIRERDERIKELEGEKMGAFYSLQDAYDNGWLTQEDLKSIAYYHNGGRVYNETIMNETYVPQPKTPEILSTETELKIKRAAAKDYRDNYNITDAEAEGFTIVEYDGTFGECIAIMKEDTYTGYWGSEEMPNIAGVIFYYNSSNHITIWRGIK